MKAENFYSLVWKGAVKTTDKYFEYCKKDFYVNHHHTLCEMIENICNKQIESLLKKGKKNPKFFDEYLELIDYMKKNKDKFQTKVEVIFEKSEESEWPTDDCKELMKS